ncbi:transcriptional regulator LeuO [Vibrio rumoiensis]|uniref:Transcriptional regulator LeuO n=1 Tax=Vibrio rumoiensis 1S-45 TaxID=1188252 RepID=A0A1E5DYR5_9VIBR|nr:transcriptional regulator LeuO [Vibrio rumoiensis]OEF22961.1 transcriptional regulator LeuO [Vibrio rumoiensis 1S-45]
MTNQIEQSNAVINTRTESTLRGVDLNLLTVFDAVMQEQNITRAAQFLGMSQPAVSNAVARLKVMFNDELFMRHGRGIQPTLRARQLFGPIRQALQLVRNELPNSIFIPETSNRAFKLAVCSPSDMRFAPRIMSSIAERSPSIQLHLDAEFDRQLPEKLRYQEVDFVIDYARFDQPGYSSTEIFSDELVVVVSANHPRIGSQISEQEFLTEKHATLSKVNGISSFYERVYGGDIDCNESYQGTGLSNILYVVGQSELLTVVPRWLIETIPNRANYKVLPYPFADNKVAGYLSWHESSEKDKGHIWMRDQLMLICGEALADAM